MSFLPPTTTLYTSPSSIHTISKSSDGSVMARQSNWSSSIRLWIMAVFFTTLHWCNTSDGCSTISFNFTRYQNYRRYQMIVDAVQMVHGQVSVWNGSGTVDKLSFSWQCTNLYSEVCKKCSQNFTTMTKLTKSVKLKSK